MTTKTIYMNPMMSGTSLNKYTTKEDSSNNIPDQKVPYDTFSRLSIGSKGSRFSKHSRITRHLSKVIEMDKEASTKTMMMNNSHSKKSSEQKNTKKSFMKHSSSMIAADIEQLNILQHEENESSVSMDDEKQSNTQKSQFPKNQLIDPSELGDMKSEYQDDFNVDATASRRSLQIELPFRYTKEH